MKTRLHFEVVINSGAEKVYEAMLGLKDKATYEQWTRPFNPTSSYEGSWDQGSKIYFVGLDAKGNKGGMVSHIEANEPGKFVSIKHLGFLEGEKEVTEGEQVEKWANGYENYTFSEENGLTTVRVDLDTVDEYIDFFQDTYPKALKILKDISEA
jgi:hypothetical protein